MWFICQKNLLCCTGNQSPHLVKGADAINVWFAQEWDDGELCFCLDTVPKNAAPTVSFLQHYSLLTAPLLALAAPAIFNGHCWRGYKERNHTAAPATEIKCPRTLLIHKKCNCLQRFAQSSKQSKVLSQKMLY